MQFNRLNEKENAEIINLYFEYIGKVNVMRAIQEFIQSRGFGILDVSYEFACNFEEWEEGYFGDNGIEVYFSKPFLEEDFTRIVTEEEFVEGAKRALDKFGLCDADAKLLIEKAKEKISN